MKKHFIVAGQRFGRLTVIERTVYVYGSHESAGQYCPLNVRAL